MQPYMNYLPSQNQMYQQNPYSQNVYSSYDNRLGVQQYQPITNQSQMPTNQPTLIGKIVDKDTDITVNDVPMNGQAAIFPSRDLSQIETRFWNADGTISKVVYLPKIDPKDDKTENSAPNGFESLNDRFNELEKAFNERFDKLESAITPKTTRKKVDVDE